ncbi:MAG: PilZ domain-containing protein, partial [bacterium]
VEDRTNQFTPGSELELELRLGEESIALRGAVHRTDPGIGFSVEFLELSPEVRHRLETYFRTKLGA